MLSIFSNNLPKEIIDEEVQKKFTDLADSQRGAPESAMLRIQHSQICQLYGWVAEHVGDLTHRMSEHIEWSKGGYPYVREKVDKVLNSLNRPSDMMEFEDDCNQQIANNINFYKSRGEPTFNSPQEAQAKLKELGKAYAQAHAALPTFNQVQKIAQQAAVAVGEFRFAQVRSLLRQLQSHLSQGRSHWEELACQTGE